MFNWGGLIPYVFRVGISESRFARTALAFLTLFVYNTNNIIFAAEPEIKPWTLPAVNVLGPDHKPLVGAEVSIADLGPGTSFHIRTTDENGSVVFSREDFSYPLEDEPMVIDKPPVGQFLVMAQAREMAPGIVRWELPATGPLTIQLKPGIPIELKLRTEDGRAIPSDLSPLIFPWRFSMAFLPRGTSLLSRSTWPERIGESKFRFWLSPDEKQPWQSRTSDINWALAIQDPDFLLGYRHDFVTTPVVAAKKLDLDLPRPGLVHFDVKVPPDLRDASCGMPLTLNVNRLMFLGWDNCYYAPIAGTTVWLDGKDMNVTLGNITPVKFQASVNQATQEDLINHVHPDIPTYSGIEYIAVKNDITSVTAHFEYSQFDLDSIKGNGTATITVTKQDGSPAAGMRVRLTSILKGYDDDLVFTSGTLNSAGSIIFRDLPTGKDAPEFSVTTDEYKGGLIGRVRLKSETSTTLAFKLPPVPGDLAPDATFYNVHTGEPIQMSKLRGKVVYIEFWASWCTPCHIPMAALQPNVKKNAPRWGDRVAVIGASIDSKARTVEDFIKQKGWNDIQQVWSGRGDFESQPAKNYGINAVPTGFLIDQKGQIIWRGHPLGFDTVREIDKLLDR